MIMTSLKVAACSMAGSIVGYVLDAKVVVNNQGAAIFVSCASTLTGALFGLIWAGSGGES